MTDIAIYAGYFWMLKDNHGINDQIAYELSKYCDVFKYEVCYAIGLCIESTHEDRFGGVMVLGQQYYEPSPSKKRLIVADPRIKVEKEWLTRRLSLIFQMFGIRISDFDDRFGLWAITEVVNPSYH